MFWAVYITRFSWRGTNGVHMWVTRSKESLHGVSMLLTKTGWLSPRPAVQRTPEPVEAKRGGREYNRWQSGYKKPAGLHNIFHRLEPPLGASSMASLNLDRCLNIPDDYQGGTQFDHDGPFLKTLYIVRLPDKSLLHPKPLWRLDRQRDDPLRADHGQNWEAGQGLLLRHARAGQVCLLIGQPWTNEPNPTNPIYP